MPKPGSLNGILSYCIIQQEGVFSFHLMCMFLGHTNPKLCLSVNAIVVNSCKIIVLGKQQLDVEILHNLKEFGK